MKQYFRVLLMGVSLWAGATSVRGQRQAQESNLKGIWQMCFYVSASPDMIGELKPSNSFKVLSDNGKFVNMTVIPNRGAIIIGSGTYEISSDSIYVEHVEKSLDLPQLTGADNILYFTLKDDAELMVLKYFIKNDRQGNEINTWCYETWKRVNMPTTYPKDLVR